MAANLVDNSKPQKEVTLNIGYELIVPVIINSDSGLIYTFSGDIRGNEAIKLANVIPQVSDAASTLYLYVLRGRDTSNTFIVDRPTMIDCLAIYNFTGDTNFLAYILVSLFKFWTILSPVLHSDKVSDEVKWELWFHCPYQVLPDVWLDNPHFMRVWRERQDNKYVRLNADEVFDFEHVTTKVNTPEANGANEDEEEEIPSTFIEKSTSYSRQTDQTVISVNEIKEMQDNNVASITNNTTYNGKTQGEKVKQWRMSGERIISNTINNVREGPSKSYVHNMLISESYMDSDVMEGLMTTFYDNGRVMTKVSYKGGQVDGKYVTYKDAIGSPIERVSEYHDRW